MTSLDTSASYGTLTEATTLTMQRLLPGPIERVWAHLTDPALRRQWLAGGTRPTAVGADFELVWRNDELSTAPAQRPTAFPEEPRMTSQVLEADAPRRLRFTWQGGGEVVFELEPLGNEVRLTLTHRRLPDRTTRLMITAGWHMHLDILAARLQGQDAGSFWNGWQRLREQYDLRLPM